MKEISNLMIDLNLPQVLKIMIIFKGKFQEEIITTHLKLIDKYNELAREALSVGDKILSENYFQHADHFTRILKEQDNYKKNKFNNEENTVELNTVKDEKNIENLVKENKEISN